MSPSPSAADWRRLGELLTRRRVELDLRYQNRTTFSAERGIDYRLAYDVEEAKRTNFRRTTLAGIAAAYAVTLDSVYAALDGGPLEPVPPPRPLLRPVPSLLPDDPGEMTDEQAEAWLRGLMAAAPPGDRNLHNLAGDTHLPVRDRVAGVLELLAFRRWVRDRKPGSGPSGDTRLRSSLTDSEDCHNESIESCPRVPFRLPGDVCPGVGMDT